MNLVLRPLNFVGALLPQRPLCIPGNLSRCSIYLLDELNLVPTLLVLALNDLDHLESENKLNALEFMILLPLQFFKFCLKLTFL